jgi:hypothetical protein
MITHYHTESIFFGTNHQRWIFLVILGIFDHSVYVVPHDDIHEDNARTDSVCCFHGLRQIGSTLQIVSSPHHQHQWHCEQKKRCCQKISQYLPRSKHQTQST